MGHIIGVASKVALSVHLCQGRVWQFFGLLVDFVGKSYLKRREEKRDKNVIFFKSEDWASDIDSMHYEFLLNLFRCFVFMFDSTQLKL